MLHVGAKATTDQKLGNEYECYAEPMLEEQTVVHSPRASRGQQRGPRALGSLCWWLEIGCGASFSNLAAIFVFAVTVVSYTLPDTET